MATASTFVSTVQPLVFKGGIDEDFNTFLRIFEVTAASENWDAETADGIEVARKFAGCLREYALDYFNTLHARNVQVKWAPLRQRFMDKFGKVDDAEVAFRQLLDCRQGPVEPIIKFARRIEILVNKAHHGEADAARDVLKRRYFLNGMNRDMRREMRDGAADNFNDAVRQAQRKEVYLLSDKSHEGQPDSNETVAAISSESFKEPDSEINAKIDQLTKELLQLRSTHSRGRNFNRRGSKKLFDDFRQSRSQSGRKRCYNCGRLGHIALNCRAPRRENANFYKQGWRGRSRSRGRGNDRRYFDKRQNSSHRWRNRPKRAESDERSESASEEGEEVEHAAKKVRHQSGAERVAFQVMNPDAVTGDHQAQCAHSQVQSCLTKTYLLILRLKQIVHSQVLIHQKSEFDLLQPTKLVQSNFLRPQRNCCSQSR